MRFSRDSGRLSEVLPSERNVGKCLGEAEPFRTLRTRHLLRDETVAFSAGLIKARGVSSIAGTCGSFFPLPFIRVVFRKEGPSLNIGVGVYLVDLASSHMLVSKIRHMPPNG